MFAWLFIPWFKFDTIPIPFLPEGVGLHAFGVLVAIGVLLGMRVAEGRARRLGLKQEVIANFIGYVVIIGFVGSHVFDRIAYYPERVLQEPWDLLMPWRSLSSFGGFLFAVVGAFVWRFKTKLPITIPLDQVAFGMPVGWMFGRTGCFVVHDHPGKLTDFFLAVNNYQYGNLPVGPRHDLGLYEVIWAALMIPLFFFLDRKPRPHGFYIGLIAVLYSPYRFMLDFLREADATYFGLTPAHYACVLSFFAGVYMLWRAYKRPITTVPPALLESSTAEPEAPTRSKPKGKAKTAR
jgi:phosphatidylglycerol:prolipoprotein diacylglycerol transferase